MCYDAPCCARSDRCCRGRCGKVRALALRSPFLGFLTYAAYVALFSGALVGFGFLVSLSVDGRANNIAAFNAANAAWPAAAPAFFNLTVRVSGTGGELVLPHTLAPDDYPDAAGIDRPTVNIHYTTTSPGGRPIAARGFVEGASTTLSLLVERAATPGVVASSSFSVPLFAVDRGKNSITYKCLASICVTVGDDLTVLSGCAIGDGYTKHQLSGCDSNRESSFTIPIDVRSEADPYVKAMRVTAGSLRFGLTMAEKALVGGLLLGVCVVLLAAACARTGQLAPPPPFMTSALSSPASPPPLFIAGAAVIDTTPKAGAQMTRMYV